MKKRKVTNPIEEIGDYMTSPVLSIEADTLAHEAAQTMESKNIGSLLVKDGEKYVGIVTETDLTRKMLAKGLSRETTQVREIMTTPLLTIDCHEPLVEANQLMAKKKVRHLGVTENEKVVGLISVRDLVHYFSNPRMRSW